MLKYITLFIFFVAVNAAFLRDAGAQPTYTEEEPDEFTGTPEKPAVIFPIQDVPLPLEKEQRNITDEQWQLLTDDPAFNYQDPGKEEAISEGPGIFGAMLLAIAEFFTSGMGMILLWVILGLVLVYIIFRMVKMRGNLFFARKDKRVVAATNEYSDEYVPEDWNKAILEAADGKNYRLAVRHAYRYLLHVLSDKGKISYMAAKTNYQYAYELAGTSLYQPFLHMTRQYEYAWYGGFDLERPQFEQYYNLLKKIQSGLA